MSNERFIKARDKVICSEREKKGIGTLGEKTLHAVLKNYFEPNEENHEIPLGKFVADIVGEQGVIEIQTRQFNRLVPKLESFLEYCNVTVVYPIAAVKYLSWIDLETGEMTSRRRSPKKGRIYDAVNELYRIKYTLDNPRMGLCLCMLELEETRYLNGWSRDKKRGSTRCDRIPSELVEEIRFEKPEDYALFIPDGLPEQFTSKDFSAAAKISISTAQTTLNLLSYLGLTEKCGKSSRSFLYRTAFQAPEKEL